MLMTKFAISVTSVPEVKSTVTARMGIRLVSNSGSTLLEAERNIVIKAFSAIM